MFEKRYSLATFCICSFYSNRMFGSIILFYRSEKVQKLTRLTLSWSYTNVNPLLCCGVVRMFCERNGRKKPEAIYLLLLCNIFNIKLGCANNTEGMKEMFDYGVLSSSRPTCAFSLVRNYLQVLFEPSLWTWNYLYL